ncbi:hypothetical protein [Methylorubrum populi]|uniref:Uncharacterized protein n=1 Tax=Methylorubrum populi TaxID=223967 RepID=A0A833J5B2_9HYPH|nr:hypothetical protein [Methylorubrum populi]KAB7783932.1 hypothetical protein F8B43_3855 [Methylorubrum populi]
MPGTKASAAVKAAEKAAFRLKVAAALERAHAAAEAAYDVFARSARRNESGLIVDTFGWADVIMYTPSRRLQDALKALGETQRTQSGMWYVSRFPREADTQSITAYEVACRAACEVLARELAGEGEFHVRTHID